MIIGKKSFDTLHETYVMGILNVTPDSFSDGGKYNTLDAALFRAEEMKKEGAAILDVGGESTRPGYTLLSEEEEIGRVVPVIEAIKKRIDIPISLDTYKAKVASAGIAAGADLINDIWGLKYDGQMAKVIASSGVSCCLMHNRKEPAYQDFLSDVMNDLETSLELAQNAKIPSDRICIDPGVGFGKTYEHNLQIINHVDMLHALGLPVLLATSRKSVIGITLDLDKDQRVEGTLATTVMAVMKGCSFVRVHDVKENVRAIKMTKAIMQSQASLRR